MNRRIMDCGKQIMAVGQEDSLADIESKIKECNKCKKLCDDFHRYSDFLHLLKIAIETIK